MGGVKRSVVGFKEGHFGNAEVGFFCREWELAGKKGIMSS